MTDNATRTWNCNRVGGVWTWIYRPHLGSTSSASLSTLIDANWLCMACLSSDALIAQIYDWPKLNKANYGAPKSMPNKMCWLGVCPVCPACPSQPHPAWLLAVIAFAMTAGQQIFYFIFGGLQNKLDYAFADTMQCGGRQTIPVRVLFNFGGFRCKTLLANPPHPMYGGYSFVVRPYSNNWATRLVRQIYVASITISTQKQQSLVLSNGMLSVLNCHLFDFCFRLSPLAPLCPTFYCCRPYICIPLPSYCSNFLFLL